MLSHLHNQKLNCSTQSQKPQQIMMAWGDHQWSQVDAIRAVQVIFVREWNGSFIGNGTCKHELYTFCVFFVFELCSAFVIAFGEFQMMHSKFSTLIGTFWPIYPANTLVVTGTIAACVCYIGVFGGMRENRCMLISVRMKLLNPFLNMNNNIIIKNIIIFPYPNKSTLHFLYRH